MALARHNATCDIYRSTNSPPAAPNVAGAQIFLKPVEVQGMEASEPADVKTWTHMAMIGPTVDIRDAWSHTGPGGTEDTIYVPDKTGTGFQVIFVALVGRGEATEHKRVLLRRKPV